MRYETTCFSLIDRGSVRVQINGSTGMGSTHPTRASTVKPIWVVVGWIYLYSRRILFPHILGELLNMIFIVGEGVLSDNYVVSELKSSGK